MNGHIHTLQPYKPTQPVLVFPAPSLQFSLVDLRHYKHIGLHRGQVRDVKVKSDQLGPGFMLTTAFDRTLKVRDVYIRGRD